MQYGDRSWLYEPSHLAETRSHIIDVVGLPFTGRSRGIHQWYGLLVDRSGLPIGMGLVLIGIQDLYLISLLQKYAAITTTLTFALHLGRASPLHVQLHIAELLFGTNTTSTGNYG